MKSIKGFTLIEIVLVMSISFMLFGFITLSFVKQQNSVSVQAIADTLISDINLQQNKAMLGEGSGSSYGIYFDSDKYTLFKGLVYSQNDPGNFVINLDSGYLFSNVTFNNNEMIFAPGSGELNNYSANNNSLQIQNENGSSIRTIRLNRYGVLIEED